MARRTAEQTLFQLRGHESGHRQTDENCMEIFLRRDGQKNPSADIHAEADGVD